MIACYVRGSTTSQNSDGQKKDIKRWLKGQGHAAKDVRWLEDKETGKVLDRLLSKTCSRLSSWEKLKQSLSGGLIAYHAANATASTHLRIGVKKVSAWLA